MPLKPLNSRQVANSAALGTIGSGAGDTLDDILFRINNLLNNASTTYGMTSQNDSNGSHTIVTGTSLLNPYLNILSPDTYTVQTGAQLVSVGTLIINGTLVVNGTGITKVL